MSVEQLEATLLKLPPAERAAFASWFDAHRHELVGATDDVSPAAQAELVLRLKEMDEHPEILEPLVRAQVDRYLANSDGATTKTPETPPPMVRKPKRTAKKVNLE